MQQLRPFHTTPAAGMGTSECRQRWRRRRSGGQTAGCPRRVRAGALLSALCTRTAACALCKEAVLGAGAMTGHRARAAVHNHTRIFGSGTSNKGQREHADPLDSPVSAPATAASQPLIFLTQLVVLLLQLLVVTPQVLQHLPVFCALLLLHNDLIAKLLALEALYTRHSLHRLVKDSLRGTRRQDVLDFIAL